MGAKFQWNKFKLEDNLANYEPDLLNYLNGMKIILPERKKSILIIFLENEDLRMLIGICSPIKVTEKSFGELIEIMREKIPRLF